MHKNLNTHSTDEVVILADENGQPAGTENKVVVHTADTPLHFAFSAWLVRDGKLLLTRRALIKARRVSSSFPSRTNHAEKAKCNGVSAVCTTTLFSVPAG